MPIVAPNPASHPVDPMMDAAETLLYGGPEAAGGKPPTAIHPHPSGVLNSAIIGPIGG